MFILFRFLSKGLLNAMFLAGFLVAFLGGAKSFSLNNSLFGMRVVAQLTQIVFGKA